MEKLYLRLSFLLIPFLFYGQEASELCVFNYKGKIVNKKTKQPVLKGDILKEGDTLVFEDKANMIVIDSKGHAYFNTDYGECSFRKLIKQKKHHLNNFTIRYFQFIYQELTGKKDKQSLMAGVYRGNDLLLMPPDSAIVSNQNLRFVWDNSSANFFHFFLRNKSTDEILKIGVEGGEIKLFKDMSFFKDSTKFEWTVDIREYADLENIGWNEFIVVEQEIVIRKLVQHQKIIEDLSSLGLNKLDIKIELCKTYGVCE